MYKICHVSRYMFAGRQQSQSLMAQVVSRKHKKHSIYTNKHSVGVHWSTAVGRVLNQLGASRRQVSKVLVHFYFCTILYIVL